MSFFDPKTISISALLTENHAIIVRKAFGYIRGLNPIPFSWVWYSFTLLVTIQFHNIYFRSLWVLWQIDFWGFFCRIRFANSQLLATIGNTQISLQLDNSKYKSEQIHLKIVRLFCILVYSIHCIHIKVGLLNAEKGEPS